MVNKKKIISIVLLLSIVVFFIVTIVSVKVSEVNNMNKSSSLANLQIEDTNQTKILVRYEYNKNQESDMIFYHLYDIKDNLLLEEELIHHTNSGIKRFEIFYDFIYKQIYKVKISLNSFFQIEHDFMKDYPPGIFFPGGRIANTIGFQNSAQLSYFLDFSFGYSVYTISKFLWKVGDDDTYLTLIGEKMQGEIEYEIRKIIFEDLEANTEYSIGFCIKELTPPNLGYLCTARRVKTL